MKLTEVAAAVIERRAADGATEFLLGQRAPGSIYQGYWEFPGGKVEAGETPHAALVRELQEELGIEVLRADPWLRREHVYEHAHVRLNFFRVRKWRGELQDHVHSALSWQRAAWPLAPPAGAPMLPPHAPVLAALALPDFYAITHAAAIGIDAQLLALAHALERGLKLVQLREPTLDAARRSAFVHAAVDLCHQFGARALVNGDIDLALAAGADGVHLPAAQLATCITRPDLPLVAASCHSAAELERAAALGCDFTVFGPVRASASHPGVPGIGWEAFAAEIAVPPAPTFALGGLTAADLETA
ncbi:MAG: Nudix family hydrolase, partial [Burkholderiaceae bacterium]|nr:Nudix family hydrolase [Burkholderiaceae bacterium]